MNRKLEKILKDINPEEWIKKEQEANQIIAAFRSNTNTVNSIDEFRRLITEFMIKLFLSSNSTKGINDDSMIIYSRAIDILKKEYPSQTESTAYKIMNTGAEGGVYQILKTLAKLFVHDLYLGKYKHQIAVYLDEISYEEREQAAKEYLEKFGDILPANYKNNSLAILVSFERVLLEHGIMMKRLRES